MARRVEEIERDMAALEEAIKAIAIEFHDTYNDYLTALGQAMRQQLIVASYYLCTQVYPEAFLSLSVRERQQLQQNLQQVVRLAQPQLRTLESSRPSQTSDWELPPEEGFTAPTDDLAIEMPAPPDTLDTLNLNSDSSTSRFTFSNVPTDNPEDLARWQEAVENAMSETLLDVSCQSNRLLQEVGILPKNFPQAVLEAAARAEPSGEPVVGRPNLLKFVVQMENEPGETSNLPALEKPTLIPIIALHLRLSEIEFADSTVMAGRNQIRNLSARLSTLRREFQKKQRERTVAAAEAAWRACWFEE
ncbi:hypothetical protein [Coleofasciculus sp. FACHB-1120]|uniref:hypothetical protein n=1 Tax=Coleofasciculus sp. FACHB-1120 TaxID=2692783 RepID=UPI00168A3F79|nr:hypothetical protein [Coleofasciculus sp. FACHB-1120]MBD2742008.1 hypothetical protein [Coleofasciculus sp. FACHB-1120]